MSFSVSFVGKPEAIKRQLAKQSALLTHQSKEEFDAILPALETVLDQNVNEYAVQLNASGYASFDQAGKKTHGTCSVEVKPIGALAE
jgi:hypothetical protein